MRSGVPQFLAILAGVAVLFASAWVREFQFLMALGDDDLPGRFDKPIWAFVLIGLAAVRPLPVPLLSPGPLARARGPSPRPARPASWPDPEPRPWTLPTGALE